MGEGKQYRARQFTSTRMRTKQKNYEWTPQKSRKWDTYIYDRYPLRNFENLKLLEFVVVVISLFSHSCDVLKDAFTKLIHSLHISQNKNLPEHFLSLTRSSISCEVHAVSSRNLTLTELSAMTPTLEAMHGRWKLSAPSFQTQFGLCFTLCSENWM